MFADTFSIKWLKSFAMASNSAPAPRVFSSSNEWETFSSRFLIDFKSTSDSSHSFQLTPEVFSRLKGPDMRRNVYGAILASAPALSVSKKTLPMMRSILEYGFCGEQKIFKELKFPVEKFQTRSFVLRLLSRRGIDLKEGKSFQYEVTCV